jgi:hypothetical protein
LKEHLEKVRNVKPEKPAAVTTGTKRKREDAAHKKKKADEARIFYKRMSILWDLTYWCDLELRHNVDVMHMEKNICDNIIGTLLKIPSKTKYSVNARIHCVNYKVHDKLQRHDNDIVNTMISKVWNFLCQSLKGYYFVTSYQV